jgi:hypothetical protein
MYNQVVSAEEKKDPNYGLAVNERLRRICWSVGVWELEDGEVYKVELQKAYTTAEDPLEEQVLWIKSREEAIEKAVQWVMDAKKENGAK